MRIFGLITARGGSKGIPRKNIKPLCGRALISWTASAALQSRLKRTFLSTDDPEIAGIGRADGIEVPFLRPSSLSQDGSTSLEVVLHFLEYLRGGEGILPDAVLLLQPTSPLRRAEHIDQAIALLEAHSEASSVVSVVPAQHSMIPESIMRLGGDGFLEPYLELSAAGQSRQKKPVYYARNGAAIYLTRTSVILENRSLYGDRILPLIMSREDSVDIDDPFDWKIAEFLLSERLKERRP